MSKMGDKLIAMHEYFGGLVTLMNDIKASTGARTVVCGGAIRDALNDRPVRDIDLYVHYEDYEKVYKLLTGRTPDWEDVCTDSDSPAYKHQMVHYQEEFQMDKKRMRPLPDSVPEHVNLIGVNCSYPEPHPAADWIWEIIGKYNFGICMVGMGSDGLIVWDERYTQDVKTQSITLYRIDWGREASMRQFEKLNKKYEGWPLVEYKEPYTAAIPE